MLRVLTLSVVHFHLAIIRYEYQRRGTTHAHISYFLPDEVPDPNSNSNGTLVIVIIIMESDNGMSNFYSIFIINQEHLLTNTIVVERAESSAAHI